MFTRMDFIGKKQPVFWLFFCILVPNGTKMWLSDTQYSDLKFQFVTSSIRHQPYRSAKKQQMQNLYILLL